MYTESARLKNDKVQVDPKKGVTMFAEDNKNKALHKLAKEIKCNYYENTASAQLDKKYKLMNILDTDDVRLQMMKDFIKELATQCPETYQLIQHLPPVIFFKNVDISTRMSKLNNSDDKEYDKNTTALHIAAEMGNLSVIKWLIDQGADIHAEDAHRRTALVSFLHSYYMNSKETPEILHVLAKDRSLLYKKYDYGYPIFDAMSYGNKNTIRSLLQMNIDLSFKSDSKSTFLFYLVGNTNSKVFEEFENLEFDVNVQDKTKNTPLHIASSMGNVEAVQFLINRKAALSILNNHNLTPLELAREAEKFFNTKDHKRCVKLLETAETDYLKCEIELYCNVLPS